MQRRPYTKADKPATLICSNPKCTNISSKLYLVEDKLIEALKFWLNNYKIDYQTKDLEEKDDIFLIKQSIASTQKEIDKENSKLNKVYDFFENGIYDQDDFLQRTLSIKENVKKLKNKQEELNSLLEKQLSLKNEKQVMIPKIENVIELYYKLNTAEDKNILLKSILAKVTYLKKEKAIKKNSNPSNFELHIYPKIPKV